MKKMDARRKLGMGVAAHVYKHVGPIKHVLHWHGSELVHVDILHVPPTPWRDCHTLLTCGMSQRPMCPPEAASECRFAELYLSLPSDWPIRVGERDESIVWPIRELANLARLAHVTETWLWYGHTIGSQDPTERITPGAGFTAWILGPHLSLGHDGCVFTLGRRRIYYHSVLPIYPEELELVFRYGPSALFRRFEDAGIDDLVDTRRPNVVL
jgi:hypothetical protein